MGITCGTDEEKLEERIVDELEPVDMDKIFQRTQAFKDLYANALSRWIDELESMCKVYRAKNGVCYAPEDVKKLMKKQKEEDQEPGVMAGYND